MQFMNGGLTVTVVNRVPSGTTDEFGNDVYTEVSNDISGCSVQPASSRENLNFGDQLTSGIVVFLPFGTDVNYIDAIIWNGDKYEVTGVPDTWTSPFTGHTAPVRVDGMLIKGAG
jgi:hypothetical protein